MVYACNSPSYSKLEAKFISFHCCKRWGKGRLMGGTLEFWWGFWGFVGGGGGFGVFLVLSGLFYLFCPSFDGRCGGGGSGWMDVREWWERIWLVVVARMGSRWWGCEWGWVGIRGVYSRTLGTGLSDSWGHGWYWGRISCLWMRNRSRWEQEHRKMGGRGGAREGGRMTRVDSLSKIAILCRRLVNY